jgi:predicted transglutaminase-like cysteine proteinase
VSPQRVDVKLTYVNPRYRRTPLAYGITVAKRLSLWCIWLVVLAVGVFSVVCYALDVDRMRALIDRAGNGAAKNRFIAWRNQVAKLQSGTDAEKLQRVNDFFNQRLRYGEDRDIWGQEEYWATTLESLRVGAGDCEDYVIAKYFTLQELGVAVEKLRFTYVRAVRGPGDDPRGVAHMVLSYYASAEAEPLVLDILVTDIRRASERPDLRPVFNFNAHGIWGAGHVTPRPIDRFSRWKDLLMRMQAEGHTF